jgi:hypothetical protein
MSWVFISSGAFVVNAMGLRHLLDGFDPRLIAGVWDAAHNALQGEEPELGLDIIWPHLCMVNLKNAIWVRKNAPEKDDPPTYWGLCRMGAVLDWRPARPGMLAQGGN